MSKNPAKGLIYLKGKEIMRNCEVCDSTIDVKPLTITKANGKEVILDVCPRCNEMLTRTELIRTLRNLPTDYEQELEGINKVADRI
jgi:ribosome-binding protein aMBF1 (putative translation factor)